MGRHAEVIGGERVDRKLRDWCELRSDGPQSAAARKRVGSHITGNPGIRENPVLANQTEFSHRLQSRYIE